LADTATLFSILDEVRDFLSREARALIENYEEVLSELRLEYLKKLNGNFLDKRPATFQKQRLAGLRESTGKPRPSREADTSIVGLSLPGNHAYARSAPIIFRN